MVEVGSCCVDVFLQEGQDLAALPRQCIYIYKSICCNSIGITGAVLFSLTLAQGQALVSLMGEEPEEVMD